MDNWNEPSCEESNSTLGIFRKEFEDDESYLKPYVVVTENEYSVPKN